MPGIMQPQGLQMTPGFNNVPGGAPASPAGPGPMSPPGGGTQLTPGFNNVPGGAPSGPPSGGMPGETPGDMPQEGGGPEEFEQVMAELVMAAFEQMDDAERKALGKIIAPEGAWVLSKIFGKAAVAALKDAIAMGEQPVSESSGSAAPQSLMR